MTEKKKYQIRLFRKTFLMDEDTYDVLQTLLPSANKHGDPSAVQALLAVGLATRTITEVKKETRRRR